MLLKERKVTSGRFTSYFDAHPYLVCVITAFIVNLIIETASRHSLLAYLSVFVHSPFVILYSLIIITFTLSLSLLFKKRFFVYVLITSVWILLGITNGVILSMRVTPLTGVDFVLMWSVLGIANAYLKVWQIIGIIVILVLFVAMLVFIAVKSPKSSVKIKKAVVGIFVLGVAILVSTVIGYKSDLISDKFGNLADAYKDYGFAYCFSRSVFDTGISRPEKYEERMDEISEKIESEHADTNASVKKPNIIILQLESFIDPNQLTDYTYSENPVPYFEQLKQDWPSGYLTVPAVGAGTANTEFEVLTGMSLDFFGTCEYPFQTILQDTATESICTDLAPYGYTAHALHNNTGTFYKRNIVYSYLGFNTFTPLEYMQDIERNENGWAKDSILTDEILKAMNSTQGRDFVFTVSVQAHGKYSREEPETPRKISVSGGEDEGLSNAVEHYVNEASEVDEFLHDLTTALNSFPEPVLLVMYGDHIPSLEIENETTSAGDVFLTEYVMWNNFGLEAEGGELYAWQLTSHIMDALNLTGGPVSQLHSGGMENENYYVDLGALEYDMLYGDYEIFDGVNPYTPTELKMGAVDISITDCKNSKEDLIVKGKNFTEFSRIVVNDDEYETEFISSTELIAREVNVSGGDAVSVAQITADGYELGRVDYKK